MGKEDRVLAAQVQERFARAQSSTYRQQADMALTGVERTYYLRLSELYRAIAATHRTRAGATLEAEIASRNPDGA